MKPLIIDTSIWVNWLRGSHAHLRDQARGRMLMMPSPIVLELTAGARSKSSVRVTNQLLQPFIQNRRVIVPSHEDYLLAGETLSELE
jgi:predicted nucleic acid-binding protein